MDGAPRARVHLTWAHVGPLSLPPPENKKLWYAGSKEVDQHIRDSFLSDLEDLDKGLYDDWKQSPWNCLAGIVLIDQFSRNMFRNTARMYAMDDKGLAWTTHLVNSDMLSTLPAALRCSLILPFMRSEALEAQKVTRCIAE